MWDADRLHQCWLCAHVQESVSEGRFYFGEVGIGKCDLADLAPTACPSDEMHAID